MTKFMKFDESFNLITQTLNEKQESKSVDLPINYVFKIDVSYSMSGDLPLIRSQLKNKLPSLMKDGDTISIIWFAGKDEAGILLEEVEIKSLKTFTHVNNAIDKWLKPVGLTAFKDPYVLTKDVIGRISANRPNTLFSSIFISDGGNNDVPWNEVIKAVKSVESDLASSTIIEYGYWADTEKLTEMASTLGGEKVSSANFDEYDVVFERKLNTTLSGGKKIEVQLETDSIYDFAFTVLDDGTILSYNIKDGKILVNDGVNEIHYFSPTQQGKEHYDAGVLYGAIYLLADRLLYDECDLIFPVLGDNFHYKKLVNAYGKQKLNDFKNSIKECVIDSTKRFPEGKTVITSVDENAYCFLNLIKDLIENESLFYPSHSDFKYNRIGAKKIIKGLELTEDDKARLNEATNINDVVDLVKELQSKDVELKFVETYPKKGYSLSNLVWNESRANLSIRIKIDGTVDVPIDDASVKTIPTYKYKTLTLVKDGLINVEKLPIEFNDVIVEILNSNNVGYEVKDKYIVIDLNSIPIINRSMVKSLSANELAKLEWELTKAKATNKVYNGYRKILFPKTSKSFVELYGEEFATRLKELGITDYNGFSPKTVKGETTDFYMGVVLDIKIKGLSSLPKVSDVEKKIDNGKKLTLRESILTDSILNYREQLNSDMFKLLSEEKQKELLNDYLVNKTIDLIKYSRDLMQRKAELIFSLILSKKWFNEFKSFDENELDLELDNQELKFIFDLHEEKIDI